VRHLRGQLMCFLAQRVVAPLELRVDFDLALVPPPPGEHLRRELIALPDQLGDAMGCGILIHGSGRAS
jgi:hypothetical protein